MTVNILQNACERSKKMFYPATQKGTRQQWKGVREPQNYPRTLYKTAVNLLKLPVNT